MVWVAELHVDAFILKLIVDSNPEVCGRFHNRFDVWVNFASVTRLVAPCWVLSNLSSCIIWPCSLMRVAWQYFLWTSIPT
jgi:hypothetical protein